MRKPMVTRTIKATVVEVKTVNLATNAVEVTQVVLPRTYSDTKKVLSIVREMIDTDTVKAIAVVNTSETEKIYGMTEEMFIALASELDGSRKVIATTANAEATEATGEATAEATGEATDEATGEATGETTNEN